ncbi:sugar transferase [Mycolicibacterium baixiangningiae]|uniref:sugar transferase n=1 Tax=Mycolicibacterium baixiangningiae TaxID=2761578 RepID=UPI001866618C|nr:sugar transferase [Mycolicibacterium baixiangningiae]
MATGQTRLEAPPPGRTGPAGPTARAERKRRSIPELLIVPWVHVTVTVLLDVISASASVALARFWETSTTGGPQSVAGWLPWLFVPILIALLAGRGMYRPHLLRNFLDELHPVEASVALAACGLLMPLLVFTENYVVGEFVLRCWLCAAVLVPAVRLVRAVVQRYLRRRFRSGAPTLVIGDGPISHQLMDHLQQLPEYGMRPVGLLDDPAAGSGDHLPELLRVDVPRLGTPADLADVVRATGATNLVVSFCPLPDSELLAVVRVAHRLGMRVWVVPRLFDAVGARARVEHVGGLPLMALPDVNPRGWQFAIKHAMDHTVAAAGLLLISPLFFTLALLVRLSSPGPIFFRQERVGRDGKPFDCLKFRSMRPPRPSDEQFELQTGSAPGGVEGVDRRTWIGKLMRQTSLDELPQLVNVLRGEMSLVGPRPERPDFVELFEMQIRRYGERHRVKAGVTGWAQVHGLRGQTSIASRAEWDNYYIENWTLWLDVKIMALTVLAVLRRSED